MAYLVALHFTSDNGPIIGFAVYKSAECVSPRVIQVSYT